MVRLSLTLVLALLSSLIPSVVSAQTFVVPSCTDPLVTSRSSYDRALPCVRPVPVPPTGPGPVGTFVPAPLPRVVPAPPMPLPLYTAPIYVAPVYVPPVVIAPRRGGIDPWIPLAVQPTYVAPSSDLLGQLLLWQSLTAARSRPAATPAPLIAAPTSVAPPPPAAGGAGWMSGFIKGVHAAP